MLRARGSKTLGRYRDGPRRAFSRRASACEDSRERSSQSLDFKSNFTELRQKSGRRAGGHSGWRRGEGLHATPSVSHCTCRGAHRRADHLRSAEDGGQGSWFSGDWYLKVGVAGFTAPKYQGDDAYELMFSPIISLGKAGDDPRFTSRNDNISLGLFDTGAFRAGLVGRLVMPRDRGDPATSPAWTTFRSGSRSAPSPRSIRPTGFGCAAR